MAVTVDEGRTPVPVYTPRSGGNYWVSTIVSTGTSGLTSGSTIDVQGLNSLTAYVSRTVSTTAVELEFSPNGTTWYQWKNYGSLVAIPAAGEFVSQEVAISSGTFGYVRALPNVSATFTSACVVILNGQTR